MAFTAENGINAHFELNVTVEYVERRGAENYTVL